MILTEESFSNSKHWQRGRRTEYIWMAPSSINPELHQLVTEARAIAKQRGEIVAAMRKALEQGKDEEVLKLARQYCGLTDEETSDRVN